MDDLVPFLIFIVIVIINLVKFVSEKGGKTKKTPPQSGEAPPKRQPSTLESFFEDLAGKLEPQPTEVADWPEDRKRPDYMQEMEEFEPAPIEAFEDEQEAEVVPTPPTEFEPAPAVMNTAGAAPEIQKQGQVAALKSAMTSIPGMVSNSKSMRIASAPILRSGTAGQIDFPLRGKTALRKAIIASLIFSPPRAYDASFDTTIAK